MPGKNRVGESVQFVGWYMHALIDDPNTRTVQAVEQ